MKLSTTFILLIFYAAVNAQSGQTTKSEKKPRALTYFCFGPGGCKDFGDTELLYGFKMKWKGCAIKNRHIRHNGRVERRINERLGHNWFSQYIEKVELTYADEN